MLTLPNRRRSLWLPPLFRRGGIQVQPCCCAPGHEDPPGSDACETNCTPGTIPNDFELVVPAGTFNNFLGCGAACDTYEGTFALGWFGSVGGICRWTYCFDPDPCNPGFFAMYVLSYRVPNLAVLILVYGITSCADTAWSNWNEWRETIDGPGDVDCLDVTFATPRELTYNLDAGTPNCGVFAAFQPTIQAIL